MIQRHVEERWEREAKEAGVSVEDYLQPKRLNMRTALANGRVARAATTTEIKADLALMGITVSARALAYDKTAFEGYDDVSCKDVGFYGLEGTPDYWGRMADWERGVSA